MIAYHVGKVDLTRKVLPMTAYKCAAEPRDNFSISKSRKRKVKFNSGSDKFQQANLRAGRVLRESCQSGAHAAGPGSGERSSRKVCPANSCSLPQCWIESASPPSSTSSLQNQNKPMLTSYVSLLF